ncbi:U3 snoRNP protein, partial [Dimargaris xerosporica]
MAPSTRTRVRSYRRQEPKADPKQCMARLQDQPDRFLTHDATLAQELLDTACQLFARAKLMDFQEVDPLDALHTQDFGDDQVWEQLQLRNAPLLQTLEEKTLRLLNWVDEEKADNTQGWGEAAKASNSEERSDASGTDDDESENTADQLSTIEDDDEDDETLEGLANTDDALDAEEPTDSEASSVTATTASTKRQVRFQESSTSASRSSQRHHRSEVDDDFFSLDQMDRFVEEAERLEAKADRRRRKLASKKNSTLIEDDDEFEDDEDDIDYFADPIEWGKGLAVTNKDEMDDDDDGSDDEAIDQDEAERVKAISARYDDFFDPITPKSAKGTNEDDMDESTDMLPPTHWSDGDDDDDGASGSDSADEQLALPKPPTQNLFESDESDDEGKSKHERAQKRMAQKIAELEDANVAPKDWTMVGEVDARARPENSLLEQDLEFDSVLRPVPVITAQVTQSLEDLIKNRILNADFNDVVRKRDPELANTYKRSEPVEISGEKSKKSLAELYEEDYLAATAEQNGDGSTAATLSPREAKLQKQRDTVRELMDKLIYKLDGLSNFHFTPKHIDAQVKVISNAPAIQMEEILPVHQSEASQLAPEEVYEKNRKELKGETERTAADKRKSRLEKKARQQERYAKENARSEKILGK